ncbi:hypothetical protein [Rubinisphaera margarita]|uniref:hypothetical protein n=1 Tax=Rubinisphaera margarita TaxID=2909586 RepID=UPI001EE984C8|nr:hypothetical protein [Rubinisphaera margarita]MCG6155371.1 hypothetical protein [Rubinisphaera margarita]
MPRDLPLTTENLTAFHEYAQTRVSSGRFQTLQECLTAFSEVQELRQALAEINGMHEAAAGCGYSRDEIAAQYEARLEMLLRE